MGNHNMKYLCNLFGYYIENVKPYYICELLKYVFTLKSTGVYLIIFIDALI